MVTEIKVNRPQRRAEAVPSHLATRKVSLPETVRADTFSGLQPSGPGIASVWGSIVSISHQCRNSRGQKWAPPYPAAGEDHLQERAELCGAGVTQVDSSVRHHFEPRLPFHRDLALGYTQDVAPDQENHKEDSQTVEVINELTDCVSLLHPSTLVSLTSSLTSGYTNIFYSPKTWTGPGAAVTASAQGPTAMSFSLCTLRYWQLRALTFLGGMGSK